MRISFHLTPLLLGALAGLAVGCKGRPQAEPAPSSTCHAESRFDACEQGCRAGLSNDCWELNRRVTQGEGGPGALSLARELFEQACRDGVADRCDLAADLFLLGEGTISPAVDERVVELQTLGCEQGSPSSCDELGGWYGRGEHGLAANFDRDVRYRRRACELGNAAQSSQQLELGDGYDPFAMRATLSASMACGLLQGRGPRVDDALADDCEKLFEGDLVINDAEGLAAFQREGWTCVSHNLTIELLSDSTSLAGLESLLVVKNRLDIRENPSLESLQGLDNLYYVRGALMIADNPTLAGLQGLSGLTTVGNDVTIRGNPSLRTLRGIHSLTRIGLQPPGSSFGADGLQVERNDLLSSLDGLEGLAALPDGLVIDRNANIETLGGLDAISTLGQMIWLTDNPRLHDINALDAIDTLHVPSRYRALLIRNNSALPQCRVDELVDRVGGELPAEVVDISGQNQDAGCE